MQGISDLNSRGTKFTGFFSLREYVGDYGGFFEFKNEVYRTFIELQFPIFAFCGHFDDLDENGEQETPHIHFYFTNEKQIRVGTLINKLAKLLRLNTLAITMSVAVSYEGCIQYLIHKTDPMKTQHNQGEIISNIDDQELGLAIERPSNVFNVDFIESSWRQSKSMSEFIKIIGIERYRLYRSTILDITGSIQK